MMDVNHINPFVKSISNVFNMMLDCSIKRTGLCFKDSNSPSYEVSAVIGLSGKANGSVVLSLSRPVAYLVVERMLGQEADQIDAEVVDAVGELTNMIAGSAKSHLSQYELSLGIPNVIVGRNHTIFFPSNVRPLCIQFETPAGPIALEVGLDTKSADAKLHSAPAEAVG
jgi:chemotaxis protein CheX